MLRNIYQFLYYISVGYCLFFNRSDYIKDGLITGFTPLVFTLLYILGPLLLVLLCFYLYKIVFYKFVFYFYSIVVILFNVGGIADLLFYNYPSANNQFIFNLTIFFYKVSEYLILLMILIVMILSIYRQKKRR